MPSPQHLWDLPKCPSKSSSLPGFIGAFISTLGLSVWDHIYTSWLNIRPSASLCTQEEILGGKWAFVCYSDVTFRCSVLVESLIFFFLKDTKQVMSLTFLSCGGLTFNIFSIISFNFISKITHFSARTHFSLRWHLYFFPPERQETHFFSRSI